MSKRPQSQRNRSHGSQGKSSQDPVVISSAEKAVHFVLAHIGAHNAPIKHTDLKKCVFPNTKVDEPLKLAKQMLQDNFGYDLQEVPGKTKTYIVINYLSQDQISLPKFTEAYRTFLSLILGYIFMARQEVEEESLKTFLRHMDIVPERCHPYFGDVNELLFKTNATYIRDQFLQVNVTDQRNFYAWGQRAKREVDRRSVLEFVCEILGSNPSEWQLQLKDCEKDVDEGMETED